MHWFDMCVGLAFLIGGIWSLFRGFAREVITLLGITAAFALAGWGYPYIARPLEATIALAWLRQTVGFLVIFFAAVVCYTLCARAARRLVKAAGLSLPDRLLGGLFGLLKVTLLVSVTLIVLAHFVPQLATRIARESKLGPAFFQTAQMLTNLLPDQAHTDFQRFYRHVQAYTGEWLPFGTGVLRPPSPLPSAPPAVLRAPRKGHPPSSSDTSDISEGDEQALRQIIQKRLRQP